MELVILLPWLLPCLQSAYHDGPNRSSGMEQVGVLDGNCLDGVADGG